MQDALQELFELSFELQKQDCNMTARQGCLRQCLRDQVVIPKSAETQYTTASSKVFLCIQDEEKTKVWITRAFFGSLVRSLEDSLLSYGGGEGDRTGYSKLIEELKALFPVCWPEDVGATYGDKEAESLCQQFGIDGSRICCWL